MPRVGFLAPATASAPQLESFRQGLADYGYVEGTNIIIEPRLPQPGSDHISQLAAELVSLPTDVIVVTGVDWAVLVRQATATIPIVTAGGGDLVAVGLASSLARPGGDVTGLSTLSPTLSGKRLELLREAVPTIARVGVVWDSTNPSAALQLAETQAAAQALGLR